MGTAGSGRPEVGPGRGEAVCLIPEVTAGSGDDSGANWWFFSDKDNMTNNQTVYHENVGSDPGGLWWPMSMSVTFLAIGCALVL